MTARSFGVVVPGPAPCVHFAVDGVRNHKPGTPCGHLVVHEGQLFLSCLDCGATVEVVMHVSFEEPPALSLVPV